MLQVIETTHEEKVKMYNTLSKESLIEMLIECNRLLKDQRPQIYKCQKTH